MGEKNKSEVKLLFLLTGVLLVLVVFGGYVIFANGLTKFVDYQNALPKQNGDQDSCIVNQYGGGSSDNTNNVTNSVTNGAAAEVQEVRITALSSGVYDKAEVTVKKGVPVKLYFTAEQNAGCGKMMILDGFNIKLTSTNGQTVTAEFTPQEEGTYSYHCGMWMFVGKLRVVSDISNIEEASISTTEEASIPTTKGCGCGGGCSH